MRKIKIKAIRPKKNTSAKHPEHPVYPYLLGGKMIRYPNHVWSTDLTYIKLPCIGYVYLVAIIDIYSRRVLSWKISNSMDGQGRWKDNIYIERLWRTVKYEDIYLQGYEDLRSLKKGVRKYFRFYNQDRFHQSLDYETPNMRCESFQKGYAAAS